MVMHWKTVSMAKKTLSKLVMPPFGPSHLPRQSVPFPKQKRPLPANAHGDGSSSTMRPGERGGGEGAALSQHTHEIWATDYKSGRAPRAQTCAAGVARLVHPADEELQADDGVDDDDEHDQHADRDQSHRNKHAAERKHSKRRTWHSGYEPERSQHPECSESFDIEASGFSRSVMGLPWLMKRWQMQIVTTRGGTIPDDDDDEIEQVPPAADVGAGVHDQAVGEDFSEGLDGEDDEEDVLDLFLRGKRKGKQAQRTMSVQNEYKKQVELLNVRPQTHQLVVGRVGVVIGVRLGDAHGHAVGKNGQQNENIKWLEECS
ncbi:hypothetical protein EYF80_016414 [Liparis tanakae]|uniref:Uncharacterized protein n=1 Tax=Liparis tanakae TaxID=230148 RepID=A0A4Z2I664_9TELE|nr:hypothetical protein EYF80_016414 [Liparis tanakae]